jgi:hypothetical protein
MFSVLFQSVFRTRSAGLNVGYFNSPMKQKKAHRSEYYWKVYNIYSGFYPSDFTAGRQRAIASFLLASAKYPLSSSVFTTLRLIASLMSTWAIFGLTRAAIL